MVTIQVLVRFSGPHGGSGHLEPLDEFVRWGPQCFQQVPARLAGRVQHGSQDRVVLRSSRAAEAAGDFLLHLEGSERPLGFVVGGGNRGVAGEPQHALPVVPQPSHQVVAPSSFPPAPPPFRGRRRPGFVPGEATGHNAVGAPPDPVGQPRRQGLSLRQVHGVDGPAEPAGHRRGPGLIVEIDPVLEFAQEMRGAEGGHGPRNGKIGPPVVVHGHAGRVPHHIAAARAHAEVAEASGARHVQPGEASAHADAGLVHMLDGRRRRRVPDMEGEAFEAFGGTGDHVHDRSL